jgi:hypothetical protein
MDIKSVENVEPMFSGGGIRVKVVVVVDSPSSAGI